MSRNYLLLYALVIAWFLLGFMVAAWMGHAKGPLRRERPRSVSNVHLVRDEDDAA